MPHPFPSCFDFVVKKTNVNPPLNAHRHLNRSLELRTCQNEKPGVVST